MKLRTGRTEKNNMGLVTGYLFVSLLTVIAVGAGAGAETGESVSSIFKNNSGVDKLKSEKPLEAYRDFKESLVDDPKNGVIHLNMGLTFQLNKEYDKAIQEYSVAARESSNPEIKFDANFNAGTAATELKQYDRALAFYQAALEIQPDSKEAKTNIELLVQSKAGGGSGDDKQDDKKDGDGKSKSNQGQGQQPPQKNNPGPTNRNQPQPFKSQDLSKQDVDRLLNELKRQEEQIRGRIKEGKSQEAPPDKDW